MSRAHVALATGLLATTSLLALTGPAFADPDAALKKTDIAGVGSDTTQYVTDALATSYNASHTVKLGSWDAVGSATIVTKTGCAAITRPNGGSAGVAALVADTTGCIDFARTLTPKASDGTQNNLVFYPMARDGVTWASLPSTKTPKDLSTSQLALIYTCQITDWHSVSAALPSSTIHAKLPQVGSALRKNFLTRIGLSDSTVGSCVDQTVQQNEGTELAGDKSAIVPHSIASWLAQQKASQVDNRGGVVLKGVNGTTPTANGALNPSFDANFEYLAYNVVKSPTKAKYTAVFGPSGFICKHPTILKKYGFAPIGSSCGVAS